MKKPTHTAQLDCHLRDKQSLSEKRCNGGDPSFSQPETKHHPLHWSHTQSVTISRVSDSLSLNKAVKSSSWHSLQIVSNGHLWQSSLPPYLAKHYLSDLQPSDRWVQPLFLNHSCFRKSENWQLTEILGCGFTCLLCIYDPKENNMDCNGSKVQFKKKIMYITYCI